MRRRTIQSVISMILLTTILSGCIKLSEIDPPTRDRVNPSESIGTSQPTDPTEPSEPSEPIGTSETEQTTEATLPSDPEEPSETTEDGGGVLPEETTIASTSEEGEADLAAFDATSIGYSYPPAQAVVDTFLKYDVHAYGPSDSKNIYLSFNAGYEYNNGMSRILDTLKFYDIKAVFFVDGAFIRTQNELTRRIAREGHLLGNHTLGHSDLAALAAQGQYAEIEAEIRGFEDLYQTVVGEASAKLYRPPSSKWSERSFEAVKRLGYRSYMFSFTHRDWEVDNQPDPVVTLESLKKQVFPGSLIMLHTVSETNVTVLEDFIKFVYNSGYGFGLLPVN